MFPSLKTIFSISAKQHPSHSVLLALCYSTSCFSNSAKLQSPGWWSKKTSVWELITLDLTPIDNVRNAKGWGEANNAPPKRSSITQPGRAPAADILFSLHAKVLPRLKWKPCWQAKVSQSKNESLHWPQQHKQKTSREIWRVGVGGGGNKHDAYFVQVSTEYMRNKRSNSRLCCSSVTGWVIIELVYWGCSIAVRIKGWVTLPPECGGGPHNRTTPWPSRTLTGLLLWVLKFSKSVYHNTKAPEHK